VTTTSSARAGGSRHVGHQALNAGGVAGSTAAQDGNQPVDQPCHGVAPIMGAVGFEEAQLGIGEFEPWAGGKAKVGEVEALAVGEDV
jgi:hypothetical protein